MSGAIALTAGCQPKKANEGRNLEAEIKKTLKTVQYENQPATPTYPTSTTENQEKLKNYKLEKKKIKNISKVEILTGDIRLSDTKVSYSSLTQKMILTGSAILFDGSQNENVKVLSQKEFKLVGIQSSDRPHFILKDEIPADKSNPMFISAEARCIDRLDDKDPNCNHVMVDIYFLHQKKIYTEQVEVNRQEINPPKATTPTELAEPTNPPVANPPSAPAEDSDEIDATNSQQTEGDDLSIAGRYKGGAEIIDLGSLYEDVDADNKPIELITTKPETPKSDGSNSPTTPKKEEPQEKIISPRFLQMKDGRIRPINQAIGFPDQGAIKNSSSLLLKQQSLKEKAYFEVINPSGEKHFGTFEMIELISRMSTDFFNKFTKTLFLSNISSANGGKLTPHTGHQNGLDADIGYPTDLNLVKFPVVVQMKSRKHIPANYSVEKTYQLFKYLFSQSDIRVSRIFVDKEIKKDLCKYAIEKNELASNDKDLVQQMFSNLQHVDGHGDHFHMRLECSKYDAACRDRIYVKTENCSPEATK